MTTPMMPRDEVQRLVNAGTAKYCGDAFARSLLAAYDEIDRLRADAHIFAINRREQIARNKAAQSSWAVVKEQRERWPEVLIWGAVGAAALLAATGWLS